MAGACGDEGPYWPNDQPRASVVGCGWPRAHQGSESDLRSSVCLFLCVHVVQLTVLSAHALHVQEADVEAVQTQLTKLGFVVADTDVKNALRSTGMHIGKVVTASSCHSIGTIVISESVLESTLIRRDFSSFASAMLTATAGGQPAQRIAGRAANGLQCRTRQDRRVQKKRRPGTFPFAFWVHVRSPPTAFYCNGRRGRRCSNEVWLSPTWSLWTCWVATRCTHTIVYSPNTRRMSPPY